MNALLLPGRGCYSSNPQSPHHSPTIQPVHKHCNPSLSPTPCEEMASASSGTLAGIRQHPRNLAGIRAAAVGGRHPAGHNQLQWGGAVFFICLTLSGSHSHRALQPAHQDNPSPLPPPHPRHYSTRGCLPVSPTPRTQLQWQAGTRCRQVDMS